MNLLRKGRDRRPPVFIQIDEKRAYLVCGADLQWRAKSANDGSLIAQSPNRLDAADEATRRGFHFMY